eukprot:Skav209225  [mRNA]  locus=scaffold293:3462:13010:- [translate_table: standard]
MVSEKGALILMYEQAEERHVDTQDCKDCLNGSGQPVCPHAQTAGHRVPGRLPYGQLPHLSQARITTRFGSVVWLGLWHSARPSLHSSLSVTSFARRANCLVLAAFGSEACEKMDETGPGRSGFAFASLRGFEQDTNDSVPVVLLSSRSV